MIRKFPTATALDALQEESGVVLPFRQPAAPASRKIRLAELFRSQHGRLLRFLSLRLGSRAEAQDVAQEAYLKLLGQDEPAQSDRNLQALLYVTARNISIDRRRQRARQLGRTSEAFEEDAVPGPERIVSARQQVDVLTKLITQLPPKCRDAFVCYKFYDMEYGEIAARMGLTESMVRKYVLRAIAYCAVGLGKDAAS